MTATQEFTKAFKFQKVAEHDSVQKELDLLESAEQNLNGNLNNGQLLDTFVQTANKVKSEFTEKFAENWAI